MKVIKVKNYEELSRTAATIIAGVILSRPDCILGLATGSSPVGTYDQLAAMYEEGILDFSHVKSVNLDEYVGLSPHHEQSYRYFMQDNLFNHIDIKPENTHVLNGLARDLEGECTRYNHLIQDLGGIDLQLLGMGHNGHIAFNEPGDDFGLETHLVHLTDSTIQANARFFSSIDEVPRQALSMGIKNIMQARHILLIASGEAKADALYEAVYGPITPHVPASILQLHDEVSVVADEAALSRIIKEGLI